MSTLQGPVDVDPQDPWATYKSGYDPTKIYTRATDGHGHGEVIHLKVSPALAAVMREACEKIPAYRTLSDVARDALIHRAHQINDWPEGHINLEPVDTEVRQAELDVAFAMREQWDRLITDLDSMLTRLIDEGDFESAEYYINQNAAVESMTPPYQFKLGAIIQKHLERMKFQRPMFTRND